MQTKVFQTYVRLVSLCVCTSMGMSAPEADDCFPCTCSLTTWRGKSDVNFADCSSRNLSYVPDIKTSIYILDLSTNRIEADDLLKLSRFRFLMALWIRNISLKRIPKQFQSAVTHIREIDFSGNILDVFSYDSLAFIKYLDEVRGLEASYFEENSFQGLESLRTLDVTLSQPNISEKVFSSLKLSSLSVRITTSEIFPTNLLGFGKTSLSHLSIFAPKVSSLSDMVFNGLSRLETICLNFGSLQSLPLHLFFNPSDENMPTHLLSLSIHGVKSLPRDILRNQQRLESLTLSGVEDLPSGIFDWIPTLHHLNLSTSNVRRVPPYWFSDLGSLKTLNLRHTGLRELGNTSFVGLNSLSVLDLSGNHLTSLPESVFQTFRETLLHVNLSNNAINHITEKIFRELFSLLSLDLSNNGIVRISTRSLNHLTKMQTLNLRNNSLYYIPDDVLLYQKDLRYLDLSNNSLQSLPNTLLQNAISLRFLDVSNNPVSTFPEKFLEHSRFLEMLRMEGNPLHCDCRLFDIKSQTSGPLLDMTGICRSPESLKGVSLNAASSTADCSADIDASSTTESYVLTSTPDPQLSKATEQSTVEVTSSQQKTSHNSVLSTDMMSFYQTTTESSRSEPTESRMLTSTPKTTDQSIPEATSSEQIMSHKSVLSTDMMSFYQTTRESSSNEPIESRMLTSTLKTTDQSIPEATSSQQKTSHKSVLSTDMMSFYQTTTESSRNEPTESRMLTSTPKTTDQSTWEATSSQQITSHKSVLSTDMMSFYQTTTSSVPEEFSKNVQTKPSSPNNFSTGGSVSEKPVVFEGKDFDGVPSSGMKAFYIAMAVIGTIFLVSVTTYVIRRGRLGLRSRSYSVNQNIIIDRGETSTSNDPLPLP